jgi:PAS domain S-box-containing protein
VKPEKVSAPSHTHESRPSFGIHDLAIIATLLLVLGLCRTHSYLLFHSIAELFSVVVAVCIFSIAWAARRNIDNGALIIIGSAYLFVGAIDLLHMLSYQGMSVLHADTDTPTQLWLGARYLESIALCVAPFFARKHIRMPLAVLLGGCVTALFLAALFVWHLVPACFIEGKGLTLFKICSEFVICGLLAAAILNIHLHAGSFDKEIFRLVILAITLAVVQESLFTLYTTPVDLFNLAGHTLKLLSFYLLFKVFFLSGVQNPAQTLFKALSDSEERYRSLMELSPNAILIDRRNRIVKVNPAALRLFRAHHALQLIGTTPFALFHPSTHIALLERIKRVRAGQTVPFEDQIINRLDGSQCHVSAGAAPIVDAEGRAIQVILRDITEQKRCQAERQTTIDFLRIAYECTGTRDLVQKALSFFHRLSACESVVLLLKDDGDTPRYEVSGSPEIFLIRQGPQGSADHHAPADMPGGECGRQPCGRLGSPKPFLRGQGSFWSNSASPATGSNDAVPPKGGVCDRCSSAGYESVAILTLHTGSGTLGLLQIKDKRKDRFIPEAVAFWERLVDYFALAIEKLRLKTLAERRAEQLESVNREIESFSYSVAHDLRNPLWMIGIHTDMLSEGLAARRYEEFSDLIDKIRNGTKRMNAIIDDMLALARISKQEISLAETDLSAMARAILQEHREAQPERRVELVIHDGLSARVDSQLINIAVGNLLSNAWKYTGKTERPRIEFGATQTDGQRVFFVKDNGAGFDMRQADKLFVPFKRLHSQEDFAGTGVGLAIVQRAISRHGGRIWAKGRRSTLPCSRRPWRIAAQFMPCSRKKAENCISARSMCRVIHALRNTATSGICTSLPASSRVFMPPTFMTRSACSRLCAAARG